MSLVFAAITPHPPLLIPAIGKEALSKVRKTEEALKKLEEDLYIAKPDVIVIISPHGSFFSDSFTINTMPEYETDLKDFGDITTKLKFKGEMGLATNVYAQCQSGKCPVTMVSQKNIDHGSAVPLYYLTKHLPDAAILPLGFCDLSWKEHLDFGSLLKEQIINYGKRVAVIASGDLSHALTTEAPAGFNAAGPKFDKIIQDLLASGNTAGMLQLDPVFVTAAAECGLRSFFILMGVLRDTNYTYKCLAYEGPFGVGYLTANFVL